MSVVNSFSVIVTNANAEAFNLGSVTQAPRSASAQDLDAACDNLVFEPSDNKIPELAFDGIKFVLSGYFTEAHQSGLYNRQLRLWETISKIISAEVRTLSKGLFTKVQLPAYELFFKTASGQIPIVGLVIEPSFAGSVLDLFKDYLNRVAKMQAQSGNQVKGIFVFCDSPFPAEILSFVEKQTGSADPVARFESILPAPYQSHINLVVNLHGNTQVDSSGLVTGRLQMLHPQLRVRKQENKDDGNAVQISYK